MYVIFPADELILMTYGPALPRIKPRPTLDRLRDPQVPFEIRTATTSSTNATRTTQQAAVKTKTRATTSTVANAAAATNVSAPTKSNARPSVDQAIAVLPEPISVFNYDSIPPILSEATPTFTQSLPPTPTHRTSLTRAAAAAASVKRSSVRSTRSKQATPPPPTTLPQVVVRGKGFVATTTNTVPMQSSPQASPRRTLERGAAIRSGTPLRGGTPLRSGTPVRGNALASPTTQLHPSSSYDSNYYGDDDGASLGSGAAARNTLRSSRDPSPSIYLEPPSPDPTLANYGPGWGRPMSPMEMPPEPVQKTPPSKTSRLRPKLHIPLGRLGRQQSDQRESNRLREDQQLHVENPIFNCENLSQNNFDAFFESGEPVYKLHSKNPASAPGLGVYDSSPRSQRSATSSGGGGGGGGFFARSPREDKASALNARSRSADHYEPPCEEREPSVSRVSQKDFSGKSSSGQKRRSFFGWRGPRGGSLSPQASMASYNGVLKDYGHSSLNEAFKSQNNVNFKLIKTVSDFTETLSHLYEEHATALQTLVSTYRKKNGELRKERPACHMSIFQAWETFLQEVETDSQASNDVASVLSRQVSRPMLDKSFHRKVQSRKIFTHRESFETIIAKTEEKLSKCRLDYKQCYLSHRQQPTQLSLTEYIDAHNAYVQQLHATNAMLEMYHCETVPQLMQELEEIHNDLYSIITESILQGADVLAVKASDQAKRYSSLTAQCSTVSPTQDLTNFVRILPLPSNSQKVPRRPFAPPQPQGTDADDASDYNDITPILRNELIFDRHSTLSLRPALDSLKREATDLEMQIRQLQDSIDSLNRTQSRGIEGQLYNKVNEMQEDLSMKKFDMRAKQIHLAAIRAQKDLFVSKVDPGSPRGERKLSAASAPSMKTKWLKAFRSLKPASGSAAQPERRNGAAGASSQPLRPNEDGTHHLQEYTYKKITACDVCSQILRGHTRQGLRCRICKLNAHGDCASQLPRCQAKQKLLRRQKSTSELENRVDVEEEKFTDLDQIYRVLKQAGELKSSANITADKSVLRAQQADTTMGAAAAGAAATISTTPSAPPPPPDISIVNVPECPERGPMTLSTTVVGAAAAFSSQLSAPRRSGIRPPNVSMPILGVQLQQQELQQQRGALPVPTQDISSSSDYRLLVNAAAAMTTTTTTTATSSSTSTAAYITCGIGIKYYGTNAAAPVAAANNIGAGTTAAGATATATAATTSNQASSIAAVAAQYQLLQQQQLQMQQQQFIADSGLRRRLFAGFRPLSGFGRLRIRSSQHRSISLPETPHSPRRQKLNLRMKSLSLDSPESSELHGQIRRRQQPVPGPSSTTGYYHGGSGGHLEHSTPPSNNSRLHSPSSPSHQGRKLLYASRGMRGGSVDLPDEMEKSQSSASTSPCPSPVRKVQKSHRLLPTNLYVILYNFKARHADELDLKAGYKVTVIDTSDPDWWKGKVLGRVGFFPSKYCVRLNANEKPLQVTHNLQVSDGERGENMTLLRDQIVIQTGDEVNGMVMVRSAENRQGYCPIKYLQEV